MGIRELNKAMLIEAKKITGNKKLKQKDIMEWSTGNIVAQEGEKTYKLPELGIYIAAKEQADETNQGHDGRGDTVN